MMAARILVAILLAALFGGWAGYSLKGQAVVAGQAQEAKAAIKKSAENVVVSAAESGRIETEVAKVDDNVTSIKAAIVKRGITLQTKQEPKHATAPDRADSGSNGTVDQPTSAAGAAQVSVAAESACGGTGHYFLDLGTVGLLNAARQGRSLESAASRDEAQSAPSTVEVTGLVVNDLDIVQMYLNLAKRHDELVDAVEKHLQDQAR